VARGGEPAGTYIGELGTDSIRQILAADGPAFYGSGHLWFVRGGPEAGTLFAQPFEPSTQELTGPVSRVADNVGVGLVPGSRYVSPSIAGPIAYRSATGRLRRQFVWFDRSGKPLGTAGEQGGLPSNPSLSPDGRYVVVQRTVQENIDLWVLDLPRNVLTRLTDDPGVDSMPVWSPDGNRVVFSNAGRAPVATLAIKRIDRTSGVERLRIGSEEDATTIVRVACDWSPDGKLILYKQFDPITGATDLWVVPTEGDRMPMPVAQTPSAERDGQFSPDGKWIAYESDESGAPEIYVQAFPGPGAKVRVSTNGGTQVRWRRDGKELFYIAPDESLMAVPIVSVGGAPGVRTPMTLFQTHIAPTRSISRQQYVVAPDGQRFLIATTDEPPASPITLIINWKGSRTTDSDK
jgi:dipeptidyl aminopeptidase/acylaminoacyl peptidase